MSGPFEKIAAGFERALKVHALAMTPKEKAIKWASLWAYAECMSALLAPEVVDPKWAEPDRVIAVGKVIGDVVMAVSSGKRVGHSPAYWFWTNRDVWTFALTEHAKGDVSAHDIMDAFEVEA